MKKGSLAIAIALNYLIHEGISIIKKQNITLDKFLEILNETLNYRYASK